MPNEIDDDEDESEAIFITHDEPAIFVNVRDKYKAVKETRSKSAVQAETPGEGVMH